MHSVAPGPGTGRGAMNCICILMVGKKPPRTDSNLSGVLRKKHAQLHEKFLELYRPPCAV